MNLVSLVIWAFYFIWYDWSPCLVPFLFVAYLLMYPILNSNCLSPLRRGCERWRSVVCILGTFSLVCSFGCKPRWFLSSYTNCVPNQPYMDRRRGICHQHPKLDVLHHREKLDISRLSNRPQPTLTSLGMVLTTPESIIEEASTQNLLDDLIDESVRTSARRPIMMQFEPSSGWVSAWWGCKTSMRHAIYIWSFLRLLTMQVLWLLTSGDGRFGGDGKELYLAKHGLQSSVTCA